MTESADTIYAEATMAGAAGVAIVRVSGPASREILVGLTEKTPVPRVARRVKLVSPSDRDIIDHGLVLWFPGPGSFSGEDVAEFHVHGGRAVVAEVFAAKATLFGLDCRLMCGFRCYIFAGRIGTTA